VFPGLDIKGGVSFFLWNRDNPGDAMVITHDREKITCARRRVLLEPGLDIFIRFDTGLAILKKVAAIEGTATEGSLALSANKAFSSIVSSRKPFGFATDFRGATRPTATANVPIHQIGGLGYVAKSTIVNGHELVSGWKVFVGYAGSGDQYPSLVLARPFLGQMGSICTETYLCIGPFRSKSEAANALQYLTTRFARFMILLRKISQHVTKSVYGFLPFQDFGQSWTDAKLYKKYELTKEEIEYIESMIRPMEPGDE
jgi:site-specific DNA-methyltransferase (adenine-specific)